MSGTENTDSHSRSLMELCKEFGEKTSMHGLGRALGCRSPYRRFVWSAMVISVFVFAIFQFVAIINDFRSYPVTTAITLKQESRTRFPAVTICNNNSRRRSLVSKHWQTCYTPEPEFIIMKSELANKLKSFYLQEGILSAHQISDMLLTCLINKRPCSTANFTALFSPLQGNCYTFTIEDPDFMYTTKAGSENGLILELNIEQYEYTCLAPSEGVYVILHENGDTPWPEDGGVYAQPGATTSISFRRTATRQLPEPYGTCIHAQDTRVSQLSFYSDKKYQYTQTACWKTCFQIEIFNKCKCCDINTPCRESQLFQMFGVTPKEGQTIHLCTKPVHSLCIRYEVEELYMTNQLDCFKTCLPPCDVTTFETVVSSALWPSDPHLDILLNKINNTVLNNMSFASNVERIQFTQFNLLRLEIYFDSLDVLEFVTQPKYDWSMLLGGVGGHLGLWLGFSLLTAMEVIELIIDTLIFCVCSSIK